MITIDLGNAIFIFCLLVGGGLLLITVLLDDVIGGALDALHIGFDIGGVTLMPPLLGFVSMFGIGGLIGTQIFQLDTGRASLVGGIAGALGFGLVWGMFAAIRRSEGPSAPRLEDLIGTTGRVHVAIPARRYGTVFVPFAGASQGMRATADVDVREGTTVRITAVSGTDLIVEPAQSAGR